MSVENKSFAVWLSDSEYWVIDTTSHVPATMSEGEAAFLDRIAAMYTVFGELFKPTRVKYTVDHMENDGPIPRVAAENHGEADTSQGMIEDDDGVSHNAVLDHIEQIRPSGGYVFPVHIEFEGKTQLYVDGRWQYVNRDSTQLFKYWDSLEEDYIGGVSSDAIQYRLNIQPLGENVTIWPTVSFNTDIWFEETQTGRYNRLQIAAMLGRLVGSFGVEQIDYKGQWEDTLSLVVDSDRLIRN